MRRYVPSARAKRLFFLVGPVLIAFADTFVGDEGSLSAVERGAAVFSAVVLLARRRQPLLVQLLTLPGTYLATAWLAGLIALYTVARLRPHRGIVAVCAMLFIAAEFLPYPFTADEFSSRASEETRLEGVLVDASAALAFAYLMRLRGELADRLHDLTESRAQGDRLLAEHVLAMERARLAREMHDVVAHQVSLISLQAGALRMSSTDPATKNIAGVIRTLSVRTLEELRHMVGVLRAASGGGQAELTPQPRLADLERLIADSALDITAEIDQWACDQCPEAVERAAFRIVQEALTNARKHAPGAELLVRVHQQDGELAIEVRNGPPDRAAVPLDLPSGGHGLIGLSERVHLLGGFFTAGTTEDGGFLVTATLPTATP